MNSPNTSLALIADPAAIAKRQLMRVNADELVFLGHMGKVPIRSMGSITLYCAIEQAFWFRFSGGPWQERNFVVVPPFARHEFAADTQAMAAVMIEAETVEHERWLAEGATADFRALCEHLKQLYQDGFSARSGSLAGGQDSWRQIAFGEKLARRELEPRIADITARIRQEPWRRFPAQECAQACDISFSRFLHLFSAQTGMPFRRFLAWKRARRVLEGLRDERCLTDIALEAGYPDSSHFSHSIKQVFGLQPRDMFARCAHITLLR